MNNYDVAQSPVVARINESIASMRDKSSLLLHVSVAEAPSWEKRPEGYDVHVRWLCWCVLRDGAEVVAPQFEVVSPLITKDIISRDFVLIFPDMDVLVDNEIEVD